LSPLGFYVPARLSLLIVLAVLSSLTYPGCLIPVVLSGCLLPAVLSRLSWSNSPGLQLSCYYYCCPGHVLTSMSCPGLTSWATLSRLTCPGCPEPAVLSQTPYRRQYCHGCCTTVVHPTCSVLAVNFLPSCLLFLVLAVLSRLYSLTFLSLLPVPATLSSLSCPACPVLAVLVSPSAKIATWRYWFCLSSDVYGGNRSFASYTKTKTVESAV
jgi:hypothetical protein